ncbi:MAG: transglutaminase family protein, partial [Polyangiales bacterium]
KLIAYLNRHPSLSYYFGSHAAGSAGQSPRADESARELFGELQLALHRLVRDVETLESTDEVATRLWSSLAPFLADRFGNSHRSEINVEKLWNPWLPGRGKLGVIELRAFRQAPTSAHAVARAALFRAILARLAVHDFPIALRDLGADLHDRYALPFFLESDLREVLGDLERAGFGLPPALAHELFADPHRVYGEVELGDPNAPITLTVRRALEHWPLVGDLSQQAGTSRLVDPSTTRVEVRVTGPSERVGRVSVGVRDGEKVFRAPTTYVDDGQRSSVVVGVRFRAFVPNLGLHPSLPARDPIELVVSVGERHYALALHAWIPGGGVYPGLPEDDAEAAKRRLDRFVLRTRPVAKYVAPPAGAAGRHTLDARWL